MQSLLQDLFRDQDTCIIKAIIFSRAIGMLLVKMFSFASCFKYCSLPLLSVATGNPTFFLAEQVVPHFSPQLKGEEDSFNGKKRIQETSPTQTKVPEISLFSGDEIFA